MLYGCWGRILEIDLNNKKTRVVELANDIYQKYLGGRGLGVYLYSEYAKEYRRDPMSEDNPIVISTGPLTGTPAPTAGRVSLTTRSPLTNTIFSSNSGGNWCNSKLPF